MAHLLLITNCFPISGYTEDAFIWPELEALHRHFDSITIIPDHIEENHIRHCPIESNLFKVDSEYMSKYKGGKSFPYLMRYLFHKHIIKSIVQDRKLITSRLKLYSLLSFYHNAYTFKQWLKQKYFKPGHPDYLAYTFWFHANTTGAALLSQEENVRIVTRAHRYDIFDEQVIYRSHYLRELTLSKIRKVYVCSKDGSNYIRRQFPLFANKIKVSFLGSTKFYERTSSMSENSKK